MSFQNPVFIPGPTNMPESLRRACDMPTLDHRSPPLPDILQPARDGVRKILRSTSAEVFIFPATGTGGWEVAITNTLSARRHGSRCAQRHVLPPLDRHVPAPRPDRRDRRDALGRGHSRRPLRGNPARRQGHRIKAVLATHNETATGVRVRYRRRAQGAGCRAAPGAAVRRWRVLHRVDAVRIRRLGRGCRRHRQPEGLHAARGPRHHRLLAKALAAVETGGLPRCFYDIRDMAKSYAANGYPYTPAVGLLNGLNQAAR
jgi:alanine-glyoxylate transaminase/serine-glyoxylate transaminase/serine-pyruvate transaminase